VGQPFPGHLGAVAHLVELVVVHGRDRLEVEDNDWNLGPLDHGQNGGAKGVGGDMEENNVHVVPAHRVAGFHGLFRGINQTQVANLYARSTELASDLA